MIASQAVEHEFEHQALVPEIQRRLVALDVEGALALSDGLSAPGRLFMAGFAQGFAAGVGAFNRHLERTREE
jgi:hypothetical protein